MKYITGKYGWIEDELGREDAPMLHSDVSVPSARIVDTGLVDPEGNTIYRTPPPIGFGRMNEW